MCGGGACCVPDVTEALKDAGRASLTQVVHTTAEKLHATLAARRAAFHGEYHLVICYIYTVFRKVRTEG